MNLIAPILNLKNRYQSLREFECTLINLSGNNMKLSGKTYIKKTIFLDFTLKYLILIKWTLFYDFLCGIAIVCRNHNWFQINILFIFTFKFGRKKYLNKFRVRAIFSAHPWKCDKLFKWTNDTLCSTSKGNICVHYEHFTYMKSSFPKGVRSIFMKVDVFGLIYRFWVALFAKTNKKRKILIGKWLKMQNKNEFCSKRG